jgi:G3E family GTPase
VTTVKIPITLFTGFFGVGKTTAIRSLLARKPKNERWAILVNEFGEVAIDQTSLNVADKSGVIIHEIPGGCMCCALDVPMGVAITEILSRVKPDRLIIEPTGIGHPAGILDQLRDANLKDIVDVGAVICFVDPRFVGDPRIEGAKVFRDQVHLADILIASKSDLASKDELERYQAWAEALFPPKLVVTRTVMGNIDRSLLDIRPYDKRLPLFPNLHSHEKRVAPSNIGEPRPGIPIRLENNGAGYQGCGWVFSHEDNFCDEATLIDYVGPPGPKGLNNVERLKGVFRVNNEWVLVDRVRNELSISPISYRRDSRLEIILSENETVNWLEIETALLRLLK